MNRGRRKSTDTKVIDKEKRATKPRRKAAPKSDQEVYKLPESTIKEFIASERRHDELDRLQEVREQKRVWKNTFALCSFTVVTLLALALWGYLRR